MVQMHTKMTKINFTVWALQVWLHLEVVMDLSSMNLRCLLFPYCFPETDVQTCGFTNGYVLKETGLIHMNTDL